jgi:hypothetical protein
MRGITLYIITLFVRSLWTLSTSSPSRTLQILNQSSKHIPCATCHLLQEELFSPSKMLFFQEIYQFCIGMLHSLNKKELATALSMRVVPPAMTQLAHTL